MCVHLNPAQYLTRNLVCMHAYPECKRFGPLFVIFQINYFSSFNVSVMIISLSHVMYTVPEVVHISLSA